MGWWPSLALLLALLEQWAGSPFCRTLQIYVPIRQFFYDLIHPDYSAVTDVYVLMFLADTVDFIIIVFGFWAFGVGWGQRTPCPPVVSGGSVP